MINNLKFFILTKTAILFFGQFVFAENHELKFGPEFTFATSGKEDLTKYCEHLEKHLIHNQSDKDKFRKYFLTENMYYKRDVEPSATDRLYACTFYSPEGWAFTAKNDQGVVEVTMTPMTASKFEKFASNIQDAIFVSAYNNGFFPQAFLGGGHINIGLKEMFTNGLLVRNFIMDFWNHNELAMGVFSYDTHNALAFGQMHSQKQKYHLKMIYDYDRNDDRAHILPLLLRDLENASEGDADLFWEAWDLEAYEPNPSYSYSPETNRGGKNHSLSFFHANTKDTKLRRFEIRAVRPQPDFYTFVKQIKLIQARVDYLGKIKTPIEHQPMLKMNFDALDPMGSARLTPPVDPQEALKAFYIYVKESDQKWADHTSYLWPSWIANGELKKFEESEWFLKQQINVENKKSQTRKRSCEGFLSS